MIPVKNVFHWFYTCFSRFKLVLFFFRLCSHQRSAILNSRDLKPSKDTKSVGLNFWGNESKIMQHICRIFPSDGRVQPLKNMESVVWKHWYTWYMSSVWRILGRNFEGNIKRAKKDYMVISCRPVNSFSLFISLRNSWPESTDRSWNYIGINTVWNNRTVGCDESNVMKELRRHYWCTGVKLLLLTRCAPS